MNDMRHLYGMPKSAAARQDEFKQNLKGFFHMQKEAALNKRESEQPAKASQPAEPINKQASIRNWDLVHYMLKSAAEAASKCKLCGKPRKECKCDKTAKCASGTAQVCKSAKLPR